MAGEPDTFYIVISFAKCVEASSFQNRSVPIFFFMTKIKSEADAALAAHSQAVCFVASEYLYGGAPV